LNIEWLEESMKLKRPASEELFLFEAKGAASKKNIETPASPLSKKVYCYENTHWQIGVLQGLIYLN